MTLVRLVVEHRNLNEVMRQVLLTQRAGLKLVRPDRWIFQLNKRVDEDNQEKAGGYQVPAESPVPSRILAHHELDIGAEVSNT